ncbi:hypothetical protein I8J29_25805 [Paenibacillus sp. MWE-103]|uniref:Translation initiation factor 2 n=1 Tax=Paenibacillus artemisiicola TaxID=1172618 RepID=A0ABS3WH36_9BACL|nr:hypothetical protein [Paenibacillus artemisiicola]MBO7747608.1 hypothetical protein [Paenibacillus artemisiicola]
MKKRNANAAASAADINQIAESEKLSDKLAVIGGAFATLGDFLGTLAAIIAIEETAADDRQAEQEKNEQQAKMADMQRQIDALQQKLERLSKP